MNIFKGLSPLKMTHKCFCGDRQRVDYFDGDRGILILEELERISYMKKFRDMEYHFIKKIGARMVTTHLTPLWF